MERGIGEFVVQNTPLVSIAMEHQLDQEKIAALQSAFSISRFLTVEQTCPFGIWQIVDMGLKALSPGINDTTTAVTCVDYLTAILALIAPRQIPSSCRYEKGVLLMIAKFLASKASYLNRSIKFEITPTVTLPSSCEC